MITNVEAITFRANKINIRQAEYMANVLKKSKNTDIICHENTDRDSANSAVSIYEYLKQNGINSRIIISKDLKSLNLENSTCNFYKSKNLNNNSFIPDTAICVDFSSNERISDKTLNHIKKIPNVLCIDHHKGLNLTDHDYTYINGSLKQNKNNINSVTSFYVDSSAVSATSIIYRFYEALGEKIDNKQAYHLFIGLVDDGRKRGLITCDGRKGEINPSEEFTKDKNAYEIYKKLKNKLTSKQIKEIAKNIDITSFLTKEEQVFEKSLYSKLNLTENNKIAYLIIEPDDKEWEKIGGDTTKNSAILNKFRQDVLSNRFKDNKLKKVKAVFVFYKADENYRVSFHSKDNLNKMYMIYDEKYKSDSTSLGGHSKRGGGKIILSKNSNYKEWTKKVINCAKEAIL